MNAAIDTELLVKKAVENFKQSYNCSQAVALAFADYYGIPEPLMARFAASCSSTFKRFFIFWGLCSHRLRSFLNCEVCFNSHIDYNAATNFLNALRSNVSRFFPLLASSSAALLVSLGSS